MKDLGGCEGCVRVLSALRDELTDEYILALNTTSSESNANLSFILVEPGRIDHSDHKVNVNFRG